jgi:hypothetical protein
MEKVQGLNPSFVPGSKAKEPRHPDARGHLKRVIVWKSTVASRVKQPFPAMRPPLRVSQLASKVGSP